jgi:hypothetical protein
MVASYLDHDDCGDEESIALLQQEGDIHATDGDFFSVDSPPTYRDLGLEDKNNIEHVSPR